MGQQQPKVSDILTNYDQRISALENQSIDDNQPVNMFRTFTEIPVVSDDFTIYTHTYKTCNTNIYCGPSQYI